MDIHNEESRETSAMNLQKAVDKVIDATGGHPYTNRPATKSAVLKEVRSHAVRDMLSRVFRLWWSGCSAVHAFVRGVPIPMQVRNTMTNRVSDTPGGQYIVEIQQTAIPFCHVSPHLFALGCGGSSPRYQNVSTTSSR